MNKQLIEKVIKSNNESCPPFTYENPILDRNVAQALSKSFVKILKISDQNSNVNNNLRLSVLENIKKLCIVEPENHVKIDENITEILTAVYEKNLKDVNSTANDSADKMLDAFLVRKLKGIEVETISKSLFNPEVVQALNNINDNGTHLEILSKEIILWHGNTNVLKEMWNTNDFTNDFISEATLDDLSLKIKPEIEQLLLKYCCKVLTNNNIENMFTSEKSLMHLIKSCGASPLCFQMCSSILNYLFKTTNFDLRIREFISTFVSNIKLHCNCITISKLYPIHLSNAALLMDIDINSLTPNIKICYIKMTIKELESVHKESENDLFLLLSHYPDWFNIYFSQIDNVVS